MSAVEEVVNESLPERKRRLKRQRKEERQRGMSLEDIWEEDNESKMGMLYFEFCKFDTRIRSSVSDSLRCAERWELEKVENYLDNVRKELESGYEILKRMKELEETKRKLATTNENPIKDERN